VSAVISGEDGERGGWRAKPATALTKQVNMYYHFSD
jgi:hypothetical protein